MRTLGDILRDKMVNGFIVALIFGLGTVNVISNIGGLLLDHIFKVAPNPWSWKIFYGQIILYLLLVIVAIFIRWCSKVSTYPPRSAHPHHPVESPPERHY